MMEYNGEVRLVLIAAVGFVGIPLLYWFPSLVAVVLYGAASLTAAVAPEIWERVR